MPALQAPSAAPQMRRQQQEMQQQQRQQRQRRVLNNGQPDRPVGVPASLRRVTTSSRSSSTHCRATASCSGMETSWCWRRRSYPRPRAVWSIWRMLSRQKRPSRSRGRTKERMRASSSWCCRSGQHRIGAAELIAGRAQARLCHAERRHRPVQHRTERSRQGAAADRSIPASARKIYDYGCPAKFKARIAVVINDSVESRVAQRNVRRGDQLRRPAGSDRFAAAGPTCSAANSNSA